MTSLKGDLEVLLRLHCAHGRDALTGALGRAIEFGRWRTHDVESILSAGHGMARPTQVGTTLLIELPVAASRSLRDYAIEVHQ